MKISNPFGALVRGIRQSNTALRLRRLEKNDPAAPTDWEQNFQPFSPQSGMPTDAFPGGRRLIVFQAALIVLFAVLLIRLIDLKVVRGASFREQANTNFKRYSQVQASRGIIYDRNGVKLVNNEPDYVLMLKPAELQKDGTVEQLIDQLSVILGQPAESVGEVVRAAVGQDRKEVSLRLAVTRDQAISLMTENAVAAVRVQIQAKRNYAAGDQTSHILGYLTEVNDEEIKTAKDNYYLPGDRIGRDGIERTYEAYLRGVKGIGEVEVDAAGRAINVRVDQENQPKAGHNLVLTLDIALQNAVVQALREGIEKNQAKAGVAVVMDVRSGEILSLVSLPAYDNNLFSGILSTEAFEALYAPEAGNPLFDRAIGGTYPPGSTFKPFVIAGALQEGIITPATRLATPGFLTVGGSRFVDWIWGQYGGNFGSLNAVGALTKSSDVFMYQVGAGYEAQPGLGSEKITYYAGQFGLGQTTGIDLPGEVTGDIPNKTSFAAADKPWYWGDTAHMAIGQGYSLVTPLQLVNGIAAIANGGTVYKPHLLKEVQASDYATGESIAPEAIRQGIVDEAHLAKVREGMRGVVLPGGTATSLGQLPIAIAGKTGTAQHDKRKADHAWFVSFAPYEDPQIATVVLLEEGGEGSKAAAPVTKAILEWYFTNRSPQK